MEYAELHCISNFTFLRGASHPQELIEQADALRYAGLALTDECSVAGVVRAHAAAKHLAVKLVVGSEVVTEDGLKLVVLASDLDAYGALCRLISLARRAAAKGEYRVGREDLASQLHAAPCLLLWVPARSVDDETGAWLAERFRGRLWLAVELLSNGDNRQLLERCRSVAGRLDLPLVASGNVHMHSRERRMLQDTLAAIRCKKPVDRLGFDLYPNAERVLKPLDELARLYPPELLRETMAILERIDFSLQQVHYEYPREIVPENETPASHLRALTEQGARQRWPQGVPAKVEQLIEHELELIAELKYEPYFLTVYDIVQFARSRGILCQGRGSAANSAVCYCLGITEVDPARMEMLMERFVSKERNEPPDIDVDFEHERREEVIQYVYAKYTRERAALAATVITYQPKSAVRDVAKALGLDAVRADRLAKSLHWHERKIEVESLEAAGLDPASPVTRHLTGLVESLVGFPRHLSQHVGGFVISERPLSRIVPTENAAMPERTVIQWDKDDLEELGLLKVDVLGLGMLSAIRRSFELIESFYGRRFSMADVPAEDPAVYRMISDADTMGVFQIESRAQMSMLPRLKPRCFYDLVIEVAIIRPGPIQGDMVHPYLRRRNGEEAVTYPSGAVKRVLERTLGVPIFQEQVMQLAIVAAGFTPGEADQLRRAMAAWRRRGDVDSLGSRLIGGMLANGYTERFAEQIFNQIRGFGEYGFPESHAASFALLVYVSAWLKCHEPAVFVCALLNSQPMGFYAPAQLIRSAREHGVELRPVDVNHSDWDSSLEEDAHGLPAIRLGLRVVKGFSFRGGERVLQARADGFFADVEDLARRTQCDAGDIGALAASDALKSLSSNRHRARWDVAGVEPARPLLENVRIPEAIPMLKPPGEAEDIAADYRYTGMSLRSHPLALLREPLSGLKVEPAATVQQCPSGRKVHTAGLVITRQRPSSGGGVVFVTIEDESGYLNLIVWKRLAESQRRTLLGAALLGVEGRIQREGKVLHVVAEKLHDYSHLLSEGFTPRSRDFR
jgi:error-prone DNA polymerase